MVERRDPVDRVIDLIVAVPVSIAAALREIVPIDTSRLERMVGRNLELIGRYAKRGAIGQTAPTRSAEPDAVAGVPARRVVTPEPVASSSVDSAALAAVAIDPVAIELPIAGYDQLSARQIVDRLDSLTSGEIAQIEAYERTNRRRQTVLGRIGQLS